jgi:hypothetical protein
MKRKLRVRDRLAILMTALWILGGSASFYVAQVRQNNTDANVIYGFCMDGFSSLPETAVTAGSAQCEQERVDTLSHYMSPTMVWWESFLLTMIIAGAFWGFTGIVALMIRWVLRGRAVTVSPAAPE